MSGTIHVFNIVHEELTDGIRFQILRRAQGVSRSERVNKSHTC